MKHEFSDLDETEEAGPQTGTFAAGVGRCRDHDIEAQMFQLVLSLMLPQAIHVVITKAPATAFADAHQLSS